MKEEQIFVQHKDAHAGEAVHSGVFVVEWETHSNGPESITVATLTPRYDSRSNAEYSTSAGTPLTDNLASTGIIVQSDFIGGFVVANSTGDSLQTVASNLVKTIRTCGGNWYATRITSQTEAMVQRIISDSREQS